jgi:hypothetical protein
MKFSYIYCEILYRVMQYFEYGLSEHSRASALISRVHCATSAPSSSPRMPATHFTPLPSTFVSCVTRSYTSPPVSFPKLGKPTMFRDILNSCYFARRSCERSAVFFCSTGEPIGSWGPFFHFPPASYIIRLLGLPPAFTLVTART